MRRKKLTLQGRKTELTEDAFHLYETYGFPVELTKEILLEEGISVAMEAFKTASEEHRRLAKEQSRQMRAAVENTALLEKAKTLGPAKFVGYQEMQADCTIQALFTDEGETDSAGEGEEVLCLLNQTPFYVESGGQVSDEGMVETDKAVARSELRKRPVAPSAPTSG
jgi:alanyl-tRNA synthetase